MGSAAFALSLLMLCLSHQNFESRSRNPPAFWLLLLLLLSLYRFFGFCMSVYSLWSDCNNGTKSENPVDQSRWIFFLTSLMKNSLNVADPDGCLVHLAFGDMECWVGEIRKQTKAGHIATCHATPPHSHFLGALFFLILSWFGIVWFLFTHMQFVGLGECFCWVF